MPRACAHAHRFLHRHDRAQRIRHVGERDHLGARRQQLFEFVEQEIAVVVDRRPLDHRAMALAQKMPRHDVGVMLHDREHDLVARRLDLVAPERIGDEIDRLGGVAGENDFLRPRARREISAPSRARPRRLRSPHWRDSAARDARWRIRTYRPAGCGRARPSAFAPRRRCRDRPAACHRPALPESENPRGCARRRSCRFSLRDRVMSRSPSQRTVANISASRTPSCAIVSTASPTNAWISSASACVFGNAARHQIKFQILVERARGRAVAALHVVGKNFQFRLVVGLGVLRQQQRAHHHARVGLLRIRAAPRSCPGTRRWLSSSSTDLKISRLVQPPTA